jgi:hypothetical protein
LISPPFSITPLRDADVSFFAITMLSRSTRKAEQAAMRDIVAAATFDIVCRLRHAIVAIIFAMLIFSILFSLSLSPRQRRIDYAIIFAIAIAIDAFGFHFHCLPFSPCFHYCFLSLHYYALFHAIHAIDITPAPRHIDSLIFR